MNNLQRPAMPAPGNVSALLHEVGLFPPTASSLLEVWPVPTVPHGASNLPFSSSEAAQAGTAAWASSTFDEKDVEEF